MYKLGILAAALSVVIATSAIAAPKNKGNSKNSPGQMMRANGPVAGYPGASGYAPGQVKKMKRNRARNAHVYAPRYRSTTGVRVRTR